MQAQNSLKEEVSSVQVVVWRALRLSVSCRETDSDALTTSESATLKSTGVEHYRTQQGTTRRVVKRCIVGPQSGPAQNSFLEVRSSGIVAPWRTTPLCWRTTSFGLCAAGPDGRAMSWFTAPAAEAPPPTTESSWFSSGSALDTQSSVSSLSYKQRLTMFFICFGLAGVFFFLASMTIIMPVKFAKVLGVRVLMQERAHRSCSSSSWAAFF